MITIFILILGLLNALNPVRAMYQKVTAPVQFGLRRISINLKDTAKLVGSVNNIRKENLELMKENQELKGIIAEIKIAQEENQLLKSQLNLELQELKDKTLLLANVLGNKEDTSGTTYVLDKGTNQGVAVNANVIIGNNLVGKVVKVDSNRSIVQLLTSPELAITVKNLDSNSNIEGLAKGDLGTSVRVTRLLPGEEIKYGDIFVTSGKDGLFIPGLSIGAVEEVTTDSAEPLRTAIVKPFIDFAKLEKVFIILE